MDEGKKKSALVVEPNFISPLPQPMWDVTCSHCDKPQARWSVTPIVQAKDASKIRLVCSHCFLYESTWAQDNRAHVKKLVKDVELERRKRFKKDGRGRLLVPDDANRIAASVALTNRLVNMRGIVASAQRGQTP